MVVLAGFPLILFYSHSLDIVNFGLKCPSLCHKLLQLLGISDFFNLILISSFNL